MLFRLTVILSLAMSATSHASTKKNIEIRVAKQLAGIYTGNNDENVDGRVGKALATLMGCEIGRYFKGEGLQLASDFFVKQVSERTGASADTVRRARDFAMKKANFQQKLNDGLAKHCDQTNWDEEYNQPSRTDRISGYPTRNNLVVARKMYLAIKPKLDEYKATLVKGDFESVGVSLFGEGTTIYEVMKNIGKVDFASEAAQTTAKQAAYRINSDVVSMIALLRDEYEQICEPNDSYGFRKKAEKVRNHASNVFEMALSPVETLIEIVVEKVMQGDSNGMARIMKDENVAISKYDVEAHEHAQHEVQTNECYDTIRDLEIYLREARGRVVFSTDTRMSPVEFRASEEVKKGDFAEDLLYSPEKYLR